MLKELADLLKEKETVLDNTLTGKTINNKIHLSEQEIDSILHNAWEICIYQTEFSIKETERALGAAQSIGYMKGIATAIRNKAYIWMLQSDYKHSLEDAKLSLNLADEEETQLIGTIWDIIALSYNGLGLYEKSVEATYKSLTLFESAGYERGISWAHHNLAMVYSNIGDIEKAEKEFRASLKKFENLNHKEGITRLNTLISQLLRKQNKFDKAMEFLQKSEELTPDDELSVQSFTNNLNKGITRRLMGNLDEAEKDFEKSRSIIAKIKNTELQAQYEYETALLFQDKGDLKSAREHLIFALDLSTKIDSKLMKKDITHALSEVHEELGESIEALKYFKRYDQFSRELMSNETLQRIHNMELQKDIELAEKEKDYHRRLQEETEKILKNVLPVPIVEELKRTGLVKPKRVPSATALFTDFVGFTAMSSHTSAEEIVAQLDYCFSGFDKIVEELGIEKLKTIGDGYMAVAGSLTEVDNHTELCVEAGLRIKRFMEEYIKMRKGEGKEFWNVRIGIHTGPLIAGVIGSNKFAYDVWGDTVNTASRIESGGQIGKVNISSQVYELINSDFTCISGGEIQAKGKGMISIYTVERESLNI